MPIRKEGIVSQPLLSIAIPTYNRAAKVDKQLDWLRGATRGLEDRCELIVSDNASKDNTWNVLQQWQQVMGGLLRVRRNPSNIGALGNIAECIRQARGRFVWVVGDDDELDDGTPARIIELLTAQPHLAAISMNFNSVGVTVYDRCFDWPEDRVMDGMDFATQALRQRYFGLAFMTAQVYRTDLAQAAVDTWPQGTWNYDYQIYITAHVACQGAVQVTARPMCTYVTGYNVYETDPRAALRVVADPAEVMVRLVKLGYPRAVCAAMVRRQARRFNPRFWKRAVHRPLLVPPILWRYVSSLLLVHIVRPLPRPPRQDAPPALATSAA
jgi:glycosyltransferase involved in cell wall biosynthesis